MLSIYMQCKVTNFKFTAKDYMPIKFEITFYLVRQMAWRGWQLTHGNSAQYWCSSCKIAFIYNN